MSQPQRNERSNQAGGVLFKLAMALVSVAFLLGPVIAVSHSRVLLRIAVWMGLGGVAAAVVAAVRYINR